MRVLPFIAAVVLLAELAGTVILATSGSWLAVAFAFALGATAGLAVWVWRRARRVDPRPGYVTRERFYY